METEKFYIEYKDNNTYLKIFNLIQLDNKKDYIGGFELMAVTNPVAQKVNRLLTINDPLKDSIIILKPMEQFLAPFHIHFISNKDLDLNTTDMANLKNSYLIKISQFFDSYINTVSNLTYYEFTILNNTLCENGIFITKDNREEKYIEILEKEDEDLIDILEKYLICKDEIDRSFAAYETYRTFKTKLNECETVEEINTVAEEFIKDWESKAEYIQLMNN
jgi:hypothetical protein